MFLSSSAIFSQKHGFMLLGRRVWFPTLPADGARQRRPRSRGLPRQPRRAPAPFPVLPSSLQASVIPGLRQKVTQNTLCLSADSWKVTLNDECSWVGLERSFLFSFSPPLFLFLSPLNCITGQPLGFIHQASVVFRPFPIVLSLLPFQAPFGQGRVFRVGCGQGAFHSR